jgi:hypothetical protein
MNGRGGSDWEVILVDVDLFTATEFLRLGCFVLDFASVEVVELAGILFSSLLICLMVTGSRDKDIVP